MNARAWFYGGYMNARAWFYGTSFVSSAMNVQPETKFKPGQMVVIQPTPQSRKMYGHVISAQWNDSFREYGYSIDLTTGDFSTAWERDIHAWREGR